MRKILVLFWVVVLCGIFVACGSEPVETKNTCGHEDYFDLIEKLENEDYDAARAIIDRMEGSTSTVPDDNAKPDPETKPSQDVSSATQPNQTQTIEDHVTCIELDRKNLLDYFELREDYIFEDTVKCYQSLQLREEYKSRLVDIRDISVEISGFEAEVFGEMDYGDQLFFPDHYTMKTGELEFYRFDLTNRGEGYISLSEYNAFKGSFDDYMVDIAISEANGTLILADE